MNVIGVIPARWGSTRLPGKSLLMLCGKPLIHWVVERALQSAVVEQLLVATDDPRIAESVAPLGVEVVMTRSDHPSGTDRVAEAVQGRGAEIVINIQGDEPLIDPGLIDRLGHAMLEDESWDMATAATPIRAREEIDNPSVVKVVWGEEHRALYFSRCGIPFVRDGGEEEPAGLHWRHVGIYAYRREFLLKVVGAPCTALENAEKLEQLRALHLGARMRVLETEEQAIGIDTADDVQYVERMILRRGRA